MSNNRADWSTTKSYMSTERKKASPFIMVASLATIAGAGVITYNALHPAQQVTQQVNKDSREQQAQQVCADNCTTSHNHYYHGGWLHFSTFGSGASYTSSSARPAPPSASRFSSSPTVHASVPTGTVSRGFFGGIGRGFASFGG